MEIFRNIARMKTNQGWVGFQGVPLILGELFAFLGFYNRDGFTGVAEPRKPPKYAHGEIAELTTSGQFSRCKNHKHCC